MEVLREISDSLLPLAWLVLLGVVLFRFRWLSEEVRHGLDRLNYFVALPALIVRALVHAPAEVGEAGRMVLALTGATLVTAVLAGGLTAALRRGRAEMGVLCQASFRGNLGFVGLPVVALVAGTESAVLARSALMFAPIMVVYNVLGVLCLVLAQHRVDAALPRKVARSLITNPLLIACGVGLGFWLTQRVPPRSVDTALELLSQTAAPVALLSLGGALVAYPVGRRLPMASLGAVLKCGACPAAAGLLCLPLGLTGESRQAVLIFAACPTAVASYVLAKQLKGDAALASACIVVSTVVSAVSLGVVLALS